MTAAEIAEKQFREECQATRTIAGMARCMGKLAQRWGRRGQHQLKPWEDVCLVSGMEQAEEA